MQTPDITKAQVIAVVQFVAAMAAAFGLDLNEQLQDAIVNASTALLIVLPLVDAWIRGRRATAHAAIVNANAAAALTHADLGHEPADDEAA